MVAGMAALVVTLGESESWPVRRTTDRNTVQ